MTVMELGAIGEFVGSIAVIGTLIYLALQIRQNTSQQRREETVSIQHGQNMVVAQMQDPAIVRAYAKAADGDIPASVIDRAMAIIWVIQYLNHFQIVFDLHNDGSLDDDRYQLWEGFAVSMVASKGIRAWWDDEQGKLAFMPNVRSLIEQKLNDRDNPPSLSTRCGVYSRPKPGMTPDSSYEDIPRVGKRALTPMLVVLACCFGHRIDELALGVGQERIPDIENKDDAKFVAVVPGFVLEGVVEYDDFTGMPLPLFESDSDAAVVGNEQF